MTKNMTLRLCFLCTTILAATHAYAKPAQRSGPISGQIVATKQGENIVFVTEDLKRPALVKQDLKAGDIIKTNNKGALSIVFADKTQIRLARNTTLEVKQVSQGSPSEIRIAKGSVWARSPRGQSRLRVSTPSATAAIRGTEWALQVDGEQTDLQVITGKVDFFNDQGELKIAGGEAARANLGRAPVRVVIVNRPEREQMLYYMPKDETLASETGLLGSAYQAAYLGNFPKALAILDEPNTQNPKDIAALKARIGLYSGNEDVIKTALKAGLSASPQDPVLLGLRAEYRANYLGRPDLALIDAQQAAHIAPNNAEILLTLSKIYLERRADIEALATINKAINVSALNAELYVQKADILISQNKPNAAKTALDKAFSIAPDLTIARLGYGQINALKGDQDAAQSEFLAASAANPGYSKALLRLAENYGRMREADLAKQQLDAADRLDPNSPFTPLYRTALGLDQYRTGDAIAGAQEALKRFKARGGVYETLSENRETGSNLSRAFRFMDLQAMGRYYGDRIFDPYEATSYYDQVLNEEAGLFSIRQDTTSFNPANGDDIQQISSFLQGVALDPLGVANAERDLQISKEGFLEATGGGTFIASRNDDLKRINGSLQGRHYANIGGGDLPIAFSLKGQSTIFHDDFLEVTRDSSAYESYVGTEISASDNLAFYGTYKKEDRHISIERTDFLRRFGGEHDFAEDQIFGVLMWNHKLADQKNFTVAAGYDYKDDLDIVYTSVAGAAGAVSNVFEKLTESYQKETFLLSANYAANAGAFDYKFGGDVFFRTREQINLDETFDAVDDNILTSATIPLPNRNANQQKIYFDTRYKLNGQTTFQGQISYLNTNTDTLQNGLAVSDHQDFINYHFGVAYEPTDGHWLRGSIAKDNRTVIPFTLSPLYTIGLRGSLIPAADRSAIDSRVLRWDAQWSDKFFTTTEVQNQVFDNISYSTPDKDSLVFVQDGDINQFSVSANYLPGGNWALNGTYTYADTNGLITGGVAQALPYVPQTTGKIGLKWTHSQRVSARLTGTYIGKSVDTQNRELGSHFNVDAIIGWEPFDKRFLVEFGVLNALNDKYDVRFGVPAPGVTVFTSGKVRF